jgi:hypothetical protein
MADTGNVIVVWLNPEWSGLLPGARGKIMHSTSSSGNITTQPLLITARYPFHLVIQSR